uniref:long-chain-fatty-acid--CoA ligase n=1 Tax=Elaeophora elaphi TaxID=1147741 RepID=A0A0R3RX70_9BILA
MPNEIICLMRFRRPREMAMIVYTSGSTGAVKGVIITFCNIVSAVRGCRIGYSSPFTVRDRGAKIKADTRGDCWALRLTLLITLLTILDRIFKVVIDEVVSSPRIICEISLCLAYERKHALSARIWQSILGQRIRYILGGNLRGILSDGAALNPKT